MSITAAAGLGAGVLTVVEGLPVDPNSFRVGSLPAALRFAAGASRAGARAVVIRGGRSIPRPALAELERFVARGVPVTVVCERGLGRGALASLLDIDGLAVALPADPSAAGAVVQACVDDGRLACVLIQDGQSSPGTGSATARVVRSGADLTLLAAGASVDAACAAAERTSGASVEVVDLCWLAPLDVEAVRESVRRTGRALVVEDRRDSWGLRVALAVGEACFGDLDAPVRCAATTEPDGLDARVAALLAW